MGEPDSACARIGLLFIVIPTMMTMIDVFTRASTWPRPAIAEGCTHCCTGFTGALVQDIYRGAGHSKISHCIEHQARPLLLGKSAANRRTP